MGLGGVLLNPKVYQNLPKPLMLQGSGVGVGVGGVGG